MLRHLANLSSATSSVRSGVTRRLKAAYDASPSCVAISPAMMASSQCSHSMLLLPSSSPSSSPPHGSLVMAKRWFHDHHNDRNNHEGQSSSDHHMDQQDWDDALFSGEGASVLRAARRKENQEKKARDPAFPEAHGVASVNLSTKSSTNSRPPRKSHADSTGSSSSSHDTKSSSSAPQLIFNAFSGRQTRSDTTAIRSLETLGFTPDAQTRVLVLSQPKTLYNYACRLQRREIAPAKSWTGSLHRQLTNLLMTTDLDLQSDIAEAATVDRLAREVQQVLDFVHAAARSRASSGAVRGVVSSDSVNLPDSTAASHDEFREAPSLVLSRDLLTDEQQKVVDLACQGHHLYIGGGAGSGKTTMLRVLKHVLQKDLHLSVAATAITGIAAVNIQGTTLHHRFGITREYNLVKKKELTKYDVLIVDEASMIPQQLFTTLDERLRKANGVDLPFGGVQVILCGDFMQLSAISDLPIIGMPLFRRNFVMVKLHEVIRQSALSLFAKQLSEMRRGVPPHDLCDTVKFLPAGSFVEDAINLLPTNAEVVTANEKQLAKLEGEEMVLPPLLLPPTLRGEWSDCYLITVPSDVSKYSDIALLTAIEQHLFRAPNLASLMLLANTLVSQIGYAPPLGEDLNTKKASIPLTPSFRAISLYPVFDDAYALRIQFPSSLDPHEVEILKRQLLTLGAALQDVNGGVHEVKDVLSNADGLHTEKNEATLAHYARTSPVGAPLRLKLGCRVLVRSNLSSTIVNGCVGTVVGFRPCTPESVSHYLLHSQRDVYLGAYANFMRHEQCNASPMLPVVDFGGGVVEVIPPCSFEVGGMADTNHYSASLIALPLTLAYAFTVHKVQGLTLVGRVHLELSKMWPCDHLLYVAMSRVKNPDQLSVSGYSEELVKVATECLIFDDSLPKADDAAIPAISMPATWKLFPGKRRFALADKASRRRSRQEAEKQKNQYVAALA
ncbi:DNA repair and recombination helicase protein PIF1, putative [Bodo saltans]|uniref:ATP-dependent DNA helicase n=1 Tax=Bodo saltans TaxID=75058 RepID=A0A0S4IUA9_BODSA|nr:DNA repair and recombination helicase protein PIF1, putative [Bodo saltans]|eukprot:CUF92138.1 DNA repair and recombination helicase protein PIF1, putative [Bodo saltans]